MPCCCFSMAHWTILQIRLSEPTVRMAREDVVPGLALVLECYRRHLRRKTRVRVHCRQT